jgi:hypothetical protein
MEKGLRDGKIARVSCDSAMCAYVHKLKSNTSLLYSLCVYNSE